MPGHFSFDEGVMYVVCGCEK